MIEAVIGGKCATRPQVPNRPRSIKRQRRTRREVAALDDAIIDALMRAAPCSVRHVFYLLTDPSRPVHVEKSERGYRHVQHRLTKLRRSGRVPYGLVVDATRRGYFTATYACAADFLSEMASRYRGDLWSMSDHYCEVWCESRSIAGVIEPLCRDLAVSLYPSGGFSSLSFIFEAAESIKSVRRGKPVIILYVGDYDPAGVLIDRSIETELRGHLGRDVPLDFIRVGITPEQIGELHLPTKPRKMGDRRAPHIVGTVEAEAMPPDILRHLLRAHIEGLLPAHALAVTKVAEQSEREFIEGMVANLRRYVRSP
jgi:hypothetical protein